jgi:hypothetical protein
MGSSDALTSSRQYSCAMICEFMFRMVQVALLLAAFHANFSIGNPFSWPAECPRALLHTIKKTADWEHTLQYCRNCIACSKSQIPQQKYCAYARSLENPKTPNRGKFRELPLETLRSYLLYLYLSRRQYPSIILTSIIRYGECIGPVKYPSNCTGPGVK